MLSPAKRPTLVESARSEAMGPERLRQDHDELGVGLVVYKAEITYLKSARYGDELEVRIRGYTEGDYRPMYDQTIHMLGQEPTLVKVTIQAAQVDRAGKLIPLREWVRDQANSLV